MGNIVIQNINDLMKGKIDFGSFETYIGHSVLNDEVHLLFNPSNKRKGNVNGVKIGSLGGGMNFKVKIDALKDLDRNNNECLVVDPKHEQELMCQFEKNRRR